MTLRGEPVTINGRTAGNPGPATTVARRIAIPNLVRTVATIGPSAGLPPPPGIAVGLVISNLDDTISLRVYWGDSAVYSTVKGGASLQIPAQLTSFVVASASGTVEWEAVALVK